MPWKGREEGSVPLQTFGYEAREAGALRRFLLEEVESMMAAPRKPGLAKACREAAWSWQSPMA